MDNDTQERLDRARARALAAGGVWFGRGGAVFQSGQVAGDPVALARWLFERTLSAN